MNFEELIKTNKQNIKNIIRMITKQDNEDIEQEVYIKLWKNSDKYEERGSLKSWVNTVAKNASKDYLKSAAVKQEQNCTADEEVLVNLRNKKDRKKRPEECIITTERQKQIIGAIENLKPKFKDVVMYCEVYGYTYEEAAKEFGCPIGTIKSRIYNAKKELAEVLKELI